MVARVCAVAPVMLLLGWSGPVEWRALRATAQSSCFVTLADGPVQGSNLGVACAFRGIPYGAPTGGDNRWRPPQAVDPWPSVLDGTGAVAGTPVGCPSVSFFGQAPSFSGNENCLTLNVWVRNPLPARKAPVIVWLHTGAFTGASGNFAGHRGQTLAAETGVIVVAPNYRLGPFGFLAHPALAAEDPSGSSGNYGLLDQQAALRWVRDNIAVFGGDPRNVTIAGTSAGGQSAGLQLVSPGSAGLFHRAIIQSAYPTTRWRSDTEAKSQGEAFAAGLGCTDPLQLLACMRSASQDAVLTALSQATQQVAEPHGRTFWEPSIDGVVIPDQPRILFESGLNHRVPTILGSNRDEGWGAFITRSFPSGVSVAQYETWVMNEFGPHAPLVLDLYPADLDPVSETAFPNEAMARVTGDVQFVCEARRLARAIERTGAPTYLYSYEHEIDTLSVDHVIHGVESNILFGNNYVPQAFPSYVLNAQDLELHTAMAGYWTRFAMTGNPNQGRRDKGRLLHRSGVSNDDEDALQTDGIVRWPAYKHPTRKGRGSDKYLILDANIRAMRRLREAQCNFWEPYFFRSVLGDVPAATP
jgi:para-nitrobenzyl esterase